MMMSLISKRLMLVPTIVRNQAYECGQPDLVREGDIMRVCGFVAVVLIPGCAVVARAQGPLATAGIEVGKAFPDVRLPSMTDGKLMSIADFRGQNVLLHVFASW